MRTKPVIKPKLSINAFGKERFFLGLSIGIFSSVIFFYFLLSLREIFKLFINTFSYQSRVWEIDPNNSLVHDFILAMLACQIGQMIFFEFCFSKPSLLSHWNFRRKTILIDNRNLVLNFLLFGLDTAFVISLFLWADLLNLLTVNGIVFWVLILTIIVIHLQAWTTINRTFRFANQWMLVTFGTMLFCSISMIQLHPIDYLQINKSQLNRIPDYQFVIQPPRIEINQLQPYFNYRFVAFSLQYKEGKVLLANERKIIEWKDIPKTIEKRKKWIPRYHHNQIFASLTVDKNVPMEFVHQLKQGIRNNGINKIAYTLLPSKTDDFQLYPFDRSYGFMEKMTLICDKNGLKESLSFLKRTKTLEIFNYDIGCHPFSFMWKGIAIDLPNKTTIYLDKKGQISLNKMAINNIELNTQLYQLFKNQKEANLFIIVDDQAKYKDYISLKTIIRQARYKVLDETCQQFYGVSYSENLPLIYRKHIRLKHLFVEIEPNSKTELKIYEELERIRKNQ